MRSSVVVVLAVLVILATVAPPSLAQAPAPKVTINGLVDFATTWYKNLSVVVRAAFAQRRKTLANALSAGLGRPAEALRAAAEAAGIDPSRRAETLTIFEFAELTRQLS